MRYDFFKELKNVYIFEPDGENYHITFEGREIAYQGDKLQILYKMTKKLPTLKNTMAFLMDKEVPFFYDPYLKSFRTYKKGSSKDERNEAIREYYHSIMPFIHAYNAGIKKCRTEFNDLDTFKVNPYISRVRFNNQNILDEECTKYIQEFSEKKQEKS